MKRFFVPILVIYLSAASVPFHDRTGPLTPTLTSSLTGHNAVSTVVAADAADVVDAIVDGASRTDETESSKSQKSSPPATNNPSKVNKVHITPRKPPNVLVLFVDDLGYGDLGIQGNESVKTPNIDILAKGGVRFTQWLSASSICTPSRGSLLTGRLPARIGLASSDAKFRVFQPISPGGLPHNELTLAEALKERGYNTYMVGKWHIGIGKNGTFLPTNQGFDDYYGVGVTNVETCDPERTIYKQPYLWIYMLELMSWLWIGLVLFVLGLGALGIVGDRGVFIGLGMVLLIFLASVVFTGNFTLMSRDSCILYEGTDIVQQPFTLKRMTQRLTQRAIDLIKDSKDTPWFMYMSYVHVHTALFNEPEFDKMFDDVPGAKYLANVAELDWSVGELLKTLKQLNVQGDTLIWFTSDNGPYLERGRRGGGAGQLRGHNLKGGKAQIWEGGIRVPGIVSYGGYFPANVVTEEPVSTMDIFPTTLNIVDAALSRSNNSFLHRLVSDFTNSFTKTPGSISEDTENKLAVRYSQPYGQLDGEDITSFILKLASNKTHRGEVHQTMVHYCGERLTAIRLEGRYKTMYATPIWDQGINSCPSVAVCGCDGSFVTTHDPPLLYDIYEDPGETKPLTVENFGPRYTEIMARMEQARQDHLESMRTDKIEPNQMHKGLNPYLKPCCNPAASKSLLSLIGLHPQCECDKDKYA